MKKIILIILLVVAVMYSSIFAANNKETQNAGIPFKEIWNAINSVKDEIASIWDAIENIELKPGPQGEPGPPGEQGAPGPEGICSCPITLEQYNQLLARVEALEQVDCITNQDCADGDPYTYDECELPGTRYAACSNLPIACLTDADCDDGDSNTIDICNNAGTSYANCINEPMGK